MAACALQPLSAKLKSLEPMPDFHGHLTLCPGFMPALTSFCILLNIEI
jgi:hypothetical protein